MRFVGQYELHEELGRGATARVYLGRHRTTGEQVCLKIFHESFASGGRAMERIRRETALAGSLVHPNIVRVVEILPEDPPVLVMQFVQGQNLERLQPRLPYVLPEVSALIAIDIAKGLEFAHERGIIHRDLKPENILISNDGHVYVSDFGLAKVKDGITVTETEALIGSLDYLSPEQANGDRVTALSDLFSLGSILYFLTTGTRPFSKESIVATLGAIRTEDPDEPQSRNPKLSAELSRIITKTLHKDPNLRYANVGEFRKALESYLKGIGLSEEYFCLRSWFAEPTSTTMEALHRSAEHLTQRCESALKKGDKTAFIRDLSHLSAKAPASAALKRLTESHAAAHSKGQMRRRIFAGIICLFLFLGAGVAFYPRLNKKPEISKPVVQENTPLPPPVTKPPPSLKKKSLVQLGTKRIETIKPQRQKAPELKPEPQPETQKVTQTAVTVAPKANEIDLSEPDHTPGTGTVYFKVPIDAEVYWDRKRVDVDQPLKNQPVGNHLLIINRPGYDLVRTEIMVKEGEPTRVKLHD
jgi:serine/threonine protein kinase